MLKLWKKDVVVAAAAAASVLITSMLMDAVVVRYAWTVGLALATGVTSLVVLEVYRRLQAQLKETADHADVALKATYHQIEALMSVTRTIEPRFPLPATRTWAASPDVLNQLCKLVLTRRPSQIFEVGSGVSTLTMAYCLQRLGHGRITSLDHDPSFAAATRQMLADHGVGDRATVIDAPLKELALDGARWLWYDVSQLPQTPPIDLLFVDGPHGLTQHLARYPALPLLAPRLADTCVIVLDDGARADERAIAKRWSDEFGIASEYLHLEKGAFIFRKGGVNAGR